MTATARNLVLALGGVLVALTVVFVVLLVSSRDGRDRERSGGAGTSGDGVVTASSGPVAAPGVRSTRAGSTDPSGPRPTTASTGRDGLDGLDPEKRFGLVLMNRSPAEHQAELLGAAARFPGIKVGNVYCIDRPCQVEVDASDWESLHGFLTDANGRFHRHMGSQVMPLPAGDGGAKYRARLWLGVSAPAPVPSAAPEL